MFIVECYLAFKNKCVNKKNYKNKKPFCELL